MERLPAKIIGTLLLGLCAATPFAACMAATQGFSSVSSLPPAPPAASATAPVTPASAVPITGATAPAAPASAPFTSATAPTPSASSAPFTSATPPAPAPATASASPGTANVAPQPSAQLAALGRAGPSAHGTTTGAAGAGPNLSNVSADKVLIDKSDHRLYLLRRGQVVAEYPIKLGLNPYGHKQYEGDFRTPEGKYMLTRRNARSDFFLSIQVSYPNKEDMAWARENGWKPGGQIMIHGQPNVPKKSPEYYASRDWTDGCVALSNSDMVDFWLRTANGTPIEIRP